MCLAVLAGPRLQILQQTICIPFLPDWQQGRARPQERSPQPTVRSRLMWAAKQQMNLLECSPADQQRLDAHRIISSRAARTTHDARSWFSESTGALDRELEDQTNPDPWFTSSRSRCHRTGMCLMGPFHHAPDCLLETLQPLLIDPSPSFAAFPFVSLYYPAPPAPLFRIGEHVSRARSSFSSCSFHWLAQMRWMVTKMASQNPPEVAWDQFPRTIVDKQFVVQRTRNGNLSRRLAF